MNGVDNSEGRKELFQYWLAEMDDALDRIIAGVPVNEKDLLDYSLDSLTVLESYLLHEIGSFKQDADENERAVVDGCARYLGETIRRTIGGEWWLAIDDPDNVNFGMPVVGGFANDVPPICPFYVVTASLDRRTGLYLSSVVSNIKMRVDSGFSDLLAMKRKLGK